MKSDASDTANGREQSRWAHLAPLTKAEEEAKKACYEEVDAISRRYVAAGGVGSPAAEAAFTAEVRAAFGRHGIVKAAARISGEERRGLVIRRILVILRLAHRAEGSGRSGVRRGPGDSAALSGLLKVKQTFALLAEQALQPSLEDLHLELADRRPVRGGSLVDGQAHEAQVGPDGEEAV